MRVRLALALVLGLAATSACGDDGGSPNVDARPDGTGIDAADAMPEVTFTSFVIDLVQNQGMSTGDPVPYDMFSTLNDPDTENPAAYAILFN